ncbi:MAG: ABC transporter substrate-binding protein [Actinocatenispora sp.]
MTVLATACMLASACSGSALGGNDTSSNSQEVRIGLLTARTGVYKSVGDDMVKGLRLYLKTHHNKLGGHPVTLSIGDEGVGDIARASAEKLVKKDKIQAMAGIVDGGSVVNVEPVIGSARIPTIMTSAGPSKITSASRPYLWSASYASVEPGAALGRYMKEHVDGPVYVIGPDYQGGHDELGGFVDAFTKAGGKLANPGGKPDWTPFPNTTNFAPYLNKIKQTGAKAVFTFYAGGPAIGFVQQYKQFVGNDIPLYAAGFLTEGSVLGAEQDAAKGVYTSMNYAADLDNPANRAFASEYQKTYSVDPTTYAMSSWDAGILLDKAIGSIDGEVTSKAINSALGKVGQVDSPRGTWQFGPNRTPVQKWYLRQVKQDGAALSNVLVSELTTLGR